LCTSDFASSNWQFRLEGEPDLLREVMGIGAVRAKRSLVLGEMLVHMEWSDSGALRKTNMWFKPIIPALANGGGGRARARPYLSAVAELSNERSRQPNPSVRRPWSRLLLAWYVRLSLMTLGHIEQAEAASSRSLELSERLDHSPASPALRCCAEFYIILTRAEAADASLRESISIAKWSGLALAKVGFGQHVRFIVPLMGILLAIILAVLLACATKIRS
jgi:hypothetical protein